MSIPKINYSELIKALWPSRVRNQLILGVALVHLVLMTIFIFDLTHRQRAFLLDQSLEYVKSLAGTLAANSTSWMLANDVTGLSELVTSIRQHHKVRYIMVVDTDGKVLAHTDPAMLGKYLKDDLSRSFLKAAPAVRVLLADPQQLDIAAPVLTNTGKCLGWARIGHDREYVTESLNRVSRNGIIYTLLAILTGSIFAMIIGSRLTNGLNRLITFTAGIKEGRLGLRLPIPSGYEVGKLSEGFNQMLDAITARGQENADLRYILDNLSEGCMIIGSDWTYHYINTAAARQRDRSREELLGSGLMEMSPGTEKSRIFLAYQRCMEGRVKLRFESEYAFKEGPPRWYELSMEPVTDGIFVLSMDITERKKAEEAQQRLNRELRAISSCNQALVRAEDEQTLLGEICRIICEEAGYLLAWVGYAENDAAKTVRPAAWAGSGSDYIAAAKLSWSDTVATGRGPAGVAIRSGKTVYVQDFVTDPRMAPWRENALRHGYRSGIALPLKDNTAEVFGVLMIYSAKPEAITPAELTLMEEMSGDLAFGITALRGRVEIKRAEKELSDSEKKYRRLIETLNEGIWMIDKDSVTTYVNPRMAEILGYTAEEMLGKKLFHFMDERGMKIAEQNVERRKRGIREQHDFEFTKKDGTRMYAILETSPVTDGSGNYAGALAAVTDITERKRTEDALQEERNLFIGGPNVAFRWKAAEGWPVEYVSPNISEQFGYRPEDLSGGKVPYGQLIHPGDLARITEEVKRLDEAGAAYYEQEYRIARANGEYRWVHDFTTPIRGPGGVVAQYHGYIRDITRQKHIETELKNINKDLEQRVMARTSDLAEKSAALEASKKKLTELVKRLETRTEELKNANLRLQEVDRMKSMFIATMSHELRTPLNSIIGFSSILLKEWCGPVNEEQKENLSTVLAAGKHLHMLINDVIDVSKIEAGKMESIVDDFDLGDLVEEALTLIKSERGGNSLKFSAPPVRQPMRTDRRRLLQCLLNLLSNAAKFTPEGSVSIHTKILSGAGGGRAEITVTDTGIGIKEEDIPRLFSPFVRLASPLTDKTRGTGLGLHLVKKITAEILKGDVFVRSVYGRGSSFGLRVPIRIRQEK